MSPHLALHPDLRDCVLEDRTLMAYSPFVPGFILTTGGWIIISVPPGLSSSLNTISNGPGSGGGSSGSGGNVPTSFNITGFGPSSITIGNSTGFPSIGSAGSRAGGGANFGASVGSGANDGSGGGGGGGGASGNLNGYGGSFSSGYSTALSSANGYGMTSSSPVGSVPVHTYAGDNSAPSAPNQTASGADPGAAPGQGPGDSPNGGLGLGQGPDTSLFRKLLKESPAAKGTMLGKPPDQGQNP